VTAVLSPGALERVRTHVQPALVAAVDRLDPATRAVAAYHLGWTEADGSPRPGGAGKGVRPALALLSAELTGAPTAVGVPGAVAVELVHNFSLLHDDVMDGDAERRHRPTVWALWGDASAILTGDAMLGLATEVLLEADSPHAAAATRELMVATRELIRGQVEDLAFESRSSVALDECLGMADGKTGALLAASSCIGALLAGAPAPVVDALREHGRHVGAAFQLVDDLLGIWGDPATTGKPVLADLRNRKKSLPVTYALCGGGPAGEQLAAWFATERPVDGDAEDDLREIAALIDGAGGRAWAAATAEQHLREAEAALDRVHLSANLAAAPRAELTDLARYLTRRES
jgi:geranylgeranyl diphosphate synthase type I